MANIYNQKELGDDGVIQEAIKKSIEDSNGRNCRIEAIEEAMAAIDKALAHFSRMPE